jgi:hypothetical protein
MFSRRLNPSIGYKLEQVDPQLDAARDEGEKRLAPLRAVLRCTAGRLNQKELVDADSDNSFGALLAFKRCKEHGAAILESLMNSYSGAKPVVRLLCSTSKLVTPQEADELDEKTRAECIPIQFSEKLALPVAEGSGEPPHVLVIFGKSTCGGTREAKMDVARLSDDVVAISLISAAGIKKYLRADGMPTPLLDKLFATDTSAVPAPSAVPRRKNELPVYLKSAIANFLERRVRLQVLCTASMPAPVSRPVSLERAFLKSIDQEKSKWLTVCAQLHASSSSCMCAAHGLRFDWKGSVDVRMETCGRQLQEINGYVRCPCHQSAIDESGNSRFNIDGMCTEGTSITITCYHRNGSVCKRGICIDSIKLTDADRLELSTILTNMAEFEARTCEWFHGGWATDTHKVAACVDFLAAKFDKSMVEVEAKQLVEQDPEVFTPREMLRRDMVAVDLMRGGGVFRHVHKRGSRRGVPYIQRAKRTEETVPLKTHETEIADTHAHLFRKSMM